MGSLQRLRSPSPRRIVASFPSSNPRWLLNSQLAIRRFGEAAYCCLHFARGGCFQGENCSFLHRIPTEADDARLGPMHDCFGRPRHASDRDDMRGRLPMSKPASLDALNFPPRGAC